MSSTHRFLLTHLIPPLPPKSLRYVTTVQRPKKATRWSYYQHIHPPLTHGISFFFRLISTLILLFPYLAGALTAFPSFSSHAVCRARPRPPVSGLHTSSSLASPSCTKSAAATSHIPSSSALVLGIVEGPRSYIRPAGYPNGLARIRHQTVTFACDLCGKQVRYSLSPDISHPALPPVSKSKTSPSTSSFLFSLSLHPARLLLEDQEEAYKRHAAMDTSSSYSPTGSNASASLTWQERLEGKMARAVVSCSMARETLYTDMVRQKLAVKPSYCRPSSNSFRTDAVCTVRPTRPEQRPSPTN